MTATATRRERIRLAVDGRRLVFHLARDGGDSWAVKHDGRALGLVYRIGAGLSESQWRARPRARGPASVAGHPTRAAAIVALYEAML